MRARDLTVGVEARDRSPLCVVCDPPNLAADSLVAEHSAACDAVEGDHSFRGPPAERGERVSAGGVGCFQHRLLVALHEPRAAGLRDLGDTNERTLLEVGLGDEADLLFARTPT